MATIKRKPGTKNWIACFTDRDGKRVQRTTGLPDRRAAQKKAEQMEEVASSPPPPATVSVENWVVQWLAAHKGALSSSTYLAYEHRTGHFLTHLGVKASAALGTISKVDIVAYRTALLERLSPTTTNLAVKILRMMFESARREGMITQNPAEGLKALKHEGKVDRRPFTPEELTALLQVAHGEWRTMILMGIYTGQRLNDMALFQWSNVDENAGEIRFRARKTGKAMSIPLAAPLRRHLATLPREGQYVMPDCAGAVLTGKAKLGTALSGQFRNLMAAAGLCKKEPHRALKEGRGHRRETRELVFHSLRHTATSMMKNAGVSGAVVMDIIGHDSPAVSAHYTHIDTSAKRKALEAMPDLT